MTNYFLVNAHARRISAAWLLLAWIISTVRADEKSATPNDVVGPPKSETPAITLAAPEERLNKLLSGQQPPMSKDDLLLMQERQRAIAAKVLDCTVGVQIGAGSGSGVIVSEDGFVLTAGHVSGKAGQKVSLVLQNGRRVSGKTLGGNHGIDSGLIKIDGDEKWPYAELGNSASLKPGMWCVATGHPGGFQTGRTSPIRVGRVLSNQANGVQTDCMLVGGDSGGPLFDAQARVIGIHSRIGDSVVFNIHVPVDTYRDTWKRLAAGEVWGAKNLPAPKKGDPFAGIGGNPDAPNAAVTEIVKDSPADKAGVKVGDVVLRLGDKKIANYMELINAVRARKPGDQVELEVQRGEEKLTLKITIGKRDE